MFCAPSWVLLIKFYLFWKSRCIPKGVVESLYKIINIDTSLSFSQLLCRSTPGTRQQQQQHLRCIQQQWEGSALGSETCLCANQEISCPCTAPTSRSGSSHGICDKAFKFSLWRQRYRRCGRRGSSPIVTVSNLSVYWDVIAHRVGIYALYIYICISVNVCVRIVDVDKVSMLSVLNINQTIAKRKEKRQLLCMSCVHVLTTTTVYRVWRKKLDLK